VYSTINRLGVGVDATFFELHSDQVNVNGQTGFAGYLETRGEYSRHFDLIYAIGVFNHQLDIQEFESDQVIESNLLGAQAKLLIAWRPLQNEFITIEAGPGIMINGEFKIDDADEQRLVGTTSPIVASEFQETNPINLNGIVGLSAGINNVRLTAHYHYAFLDALNAQSVAGSDVDGNISFLTAGLRIYF
jgi:hypothetical protein